MNTIRMYTQNYHHMSNHRNGSPQNTFIKLQRSRSNDALGFNIRGGKEHMCGIFISKVLPNTEAQRLGLQEGDEILEVNETPFEDMDHAQAVRVLKQNTDVELIVRYFPYGYMKTYEKTRVASQSPYDNR